MAYRAEMERLSAGFAALSGPARALLAVGCADRLVRAAGAQIDDEVKQAVHSAWTAVTNGSSLSPAAITDLRNRDDVNDDPVAAIVHASEAVNGDRDSGWHAVTRLVDSASARVPYAPGESTFRPLDEDLRSEPVASEVRWLQEALRRLSDGERSHAIVWLRSD